MPSGADPEAQRLHEYVRFARLLSTLDERRRLWAALEEALLLLQGTDAVVEGERYLVGRLGARLKRAGEALAKLRRAKRESVALARLTDIESELAAVEWELAAEVAASLNRRASELRESIERIEERLGGWHAIVREMGEALIDARRARAPVVTEGREHLRLEGLVSRAERSVREQAYAAAAHAVAELEEGGEAARQNLASINTKIATARLHVRQADLLLLAAPLDEKRHFEWTVLLRTPSEPGTHGINIQGSSTLVEQDRVAMTMLIDRVTKEVDEGLRRAFIRGQKSGASLEAKPGAGPRGLANADAREAARGDGSGWGTVRDATPESETSAAAGVSVANAEIRSIGTLMYRLFMPEGMQTYLNSTLCSLTLTSNDLELPWELMYRDDQFLCLERPIARMPMGRAFPRADQPPPRGPSKLRFLLLYADPIGSLAAAEREVDQIHDALRAQWKDHIQVDVLKRDEVTGAALNEHLMNGRYDVVHYAGHAAFDRDNPDRSGLLLHHGEVFFAQKVRRLLRGRPLVFLNACESSRTANERAPQVVGEYLQKPAGGLASAFLYGGAAGCVGALWPIYDAPAAQFAIRFYANVLEGHMIGEAMRRARCEIKETYPEHITWAAFVLYGDPTYSLVE